MLQDIRDGNLESAFKALDQEWAASGVSYTRSQEVLVKHNMSIKHNIKHKMRLYYSRIRFTAS